MPKAFLRSRMDKGKSPKRTKVPILHFYNYLIIKFLINKSQKV